MAGESERGVALATRIVGFHPVKWRLGYSMDSIDGLRLLPHTVLVQSKANRRPEMSVSKVTWASTTS